MSQTEKFITFKQETLDKCLKVSLNEVDKFLEIYAGSLRLFRGESLNFGVWLKGSVEIVEYINAHVDVHEKSLRLIDLQKIFAKHRFDTRLLIRKEEFAKYVDHLRSNRLSAFKANTGNSASVVQNAYVQLCNCSDRLKSLFTIEVLQDSEQVITEVVANLSRNKIWEQAINVLLNFTDYDHAAYTAIIAVSVGKALKLSDNDLKILSLGALCHDLGLTRLAVSSWYPDDVPKDEIKTYERHPEMGVQILNSIDARTTPLPEEVFFIVMQHHERHNGSGYPNGKKGLMSKDNRDGIHLFAAIVGLADTIAYYFVPREDGNPFDLYQACKSVNRLDGCFCPDVVKAFNRLSNFEPDPVSDKRIP